MATKDTLSLDALKRRIDNGEKVCPSNDLPQKYREAATRMIQFHANGEVMGAYLEKPFINKAPSLERKLAFSAKTQDEIGHAQLLYRAAETLGVKTREQMLDELATGEAGFINTFHYPLETYAETPMIAFFIDGAGMQRQSHLQNSSFEPYANAMEKICFEEGFHVKHGEAIMHEFATGPRKHQEMLQEAFDKWWPRIIQFFGPTDDESTHTDFGKAVGLKLKSNDEQRQEFLNVYIPKARKYGLELPDEPRIREQSDGTYEVVESDLDWEEFWKITRNEFDPGRGQVDSRAQAQEAVSWVQDVLAADSSSGSSSAVAGD